MEKTNLINSLETHVSALDDFKFQLLRLLRHLQETRQFTIAENDSAWDSLFQTPKEALSIIRKAVEDFVSHHEKLANRYELEFSRNVFSLDQQLTSKREQVRREDKLLMEAQKRAHGYEQMVAMLFVEKDTLMHTILMHRARLAMHLESGEKQRAAIHQRLSGTMETYQATVHQNRQLHDERDELVRRRDTRTQFEAGRMLSHDELLRNVAEMKAKIARESNELNTAAAELEQSRQELTSLSRTLDSYRDNLKTRELRDSEIENERLRSVMSIEKADFDEKLAREVERGRDLAATLMTLSREIDHLNQQISLTERKLHTQMMRIPDFAQIHQALDREKAQGQRYKDFVRKRQEVLDQFHTNTKRQDERNEEDSQTRMRQRAARMALQAERTRPINTLDLEAT
jgi:chromosome segregation ATPase